MLSRCQSELLIAYNRHSQSRYLTAWAWLHWRGFEACGFSRSHFSLFRVAGVSVSSFSSVKAMEEPIPCDAVLCRGLIAGHYRRHLDTGTGLELWAGQGISIVWALLIAGWCLWTVQRRNTLWSLLSFLSPHYITSAQLISITGKLP